MKRNALKHLKIYTAILFLLELAILCLAVLLLRNALSDYELGQLKREIDTQLDNVAESYQDAQNIRVESHEGLAEIYRHKLLTAVYYLEHTLSDHPAEDPSQEGGDSPDAGEEESEPPEGLSASPGAWLELLTQEDLEPLLGLLDAWTIHITDGEGTILLKAVSPETPSGTNPRAITDFTKRAMDSESGVSAMGYVYPVGDTSGTPVMYGLSMRLAPQKVMVVCFPVPDNDIRPYTTTTGAVMSRNPVSMGGAIFAVRTRDHVVLRFPDPAFAEWDTVYLEDLGVDESILTDGGFGTVEFSGKSYYYGCKMGLGGSGYFFCIIPTASLEKNQNVSLGIMVCVLLFFMTFITFYAAMLQRERILGKAKKLRSFRPRLAGVMVVGIVLSYTAWLYALMLYTLSNASVTNMDGVRQLDALLDTNITTTGAIHEMYDRMYLNKAFAAADLLNRKPDLKTREDLARLRDALGVEHIFIFDSEGVETVTDTTYRGFVLSSDPEDQSYPFRQLLLGVPYVVQEERADDVEGITRQYIGAMLEDAEGYSDGFVEISLLPEAKLKALAASSDETLYQMFHRGGDSFAFSIRDGKFLYFPNESYIGRNVADFGVTEHDMTDELVGYLSIGRERYYVSSKLRQDGTLIYVGTNTDNLRITDLHTALKCLGVTVLSYLLILLLTLLEGWILDRDLARQTSAAEAEGETLPEDGGDGIREGKGTDPQPPPIPARERRGRIGRTVDVITNSGRVKRTISAERRWSGLATQWDELTAEEQMRYFIHFGVGALSLLVCLIFAWGDSIFDENSVIMFILRGQWENGLNLFAMTSCVITLCVVSTFTIAVRYLLSLIGRLMDPRVETVCRLLSSLLKYLAAAVIVAVWLSRCGVEMATIMTTAGVISLVIGLGANSLIGDILTGVFIIMEGEFRVGDIVTVAGYTGRVQEIGVRTTKILSKDGNVKIINNKSMGDVINRTRNNSMASVSIGISFEESLERVEEILNRELPLMKERIPAISEGPSYLGVTQLGPRHAELTIVATCEELKRGRVNRGLMRELRLLCERHHLKLSDGSWVLESKAEETKPS